MKKQKIAFFTAIFLLMSLLPSLGMLVTGPSPLLSNEAAPRTPSLNAEMLSDTADYVGTRFAFRPLLVTARSFLYEKLLRSSAEDQVLVGRGGQLYYASTLDDYCGVGLTEAELRAIAGHLAALQQSVQARGGRFLFAVAPNKNSIIPEGMPARFPAGHEDSNYARLLPLLEEAGVAYVDLESVLAEHPGWYYRTDSHWTAEGAAAAADALLDALGRESSFSSGPFEAGGTHVGDLYRMLYPLGGGREPELSYAPGFRYETAADPRGGEAVRIETRSASGEGSLFCLRDSFGIALYPYLAEAFDSAVFSRSSDYSTEAFADPDADVVILEIVERNLPRLLPEA